MQKIEPLAVILQRLTLLHMLRIKVVLQRKLVAALTTSDLLALALAMPECRVGYAIAARPIYVRRNQGCHHRRLRIGIGEGESILAIRI